MIIVGVGRSRPGTTRSVTIRLSLGTKITFARWVCYTTFVTLMFKRASQTFHTLVEFSTITLGYKWCSPSRGILYTPRGMRFWIVHTKLLGTDPKFPVGCTPRHIVKMLLAHVSKVGIIKIPVPASRCQVTNNLAVFHERRCIHRIFAGTVYIYQQKSGRLKSTSQY